MHLHRKSDSGIITRIYPERTEFQCRLCLKYTLKRQTIHRANRLSRLRMYGAMMSDRRKGTVPLSSQIVCVN